MIIRRAIPMLLRADADAASGTGHIMRCLALAEACRNGGGAPLFYSAHMPGPLQQLVRRRGFEVRKQDAAAGTVRDALNTAEQAGQWGADWVVLDGYQFGSDFQDRLRRSGLKVLAIDDYGHAERYSANLVLNQNAHAKPALYPRRARDTRLLLGPRYALLRREFLGVSRRRAIGARAKRLLVLAGGSDPANITPMILKALALLPHADLQVKAVVGSANRKTAALRRLRLRYQHELVPGDSMPALMRWTEVAVSAAGITTWELLYLGVPCALVICAENQRASAEALAASGVAMNLGWHAELRPAEVATRVDELLSNRGLRRRFHREGKKIVDGKGAQRVIEAMAGEAIYARSISRK